MTTLAQSGFRAMVASSPPQTTRGETLQSPFSRLFDEYERLREHGCDCAEADDDAGFEEAYRQAEKVRDLLFATPALTRENAAVKARFLAHICKEREGDMTDTNAVEAMQDLARFIEGGG